MAVIFPRVYDVALFLFHQDVILHACLILESILVQGGQLGQPGGSRHLQKLFEVRLFLTLEAKSVNQALQGII